MLHVTDSKTKGLTISIEVANPSQKMVLEAILNTLRCGYSSKQNDAQFVHYTIDAKEATRVRAMIASWHTTMGDLQYGVDLRTHLP